MKTLRKHLDSLPEEVWKYYSISTLTLDDAYKRPEYFVKQYFKDGEKYIVVNDIKNFLSESFRLEHSVSSFLLAAWLSKSVSLSSLISENGFDIAANHYVFILFLSFLYHDYYYLKEKKTYDHLKTLDNPFEGFVQEFKNKFPFVKDTNFLVPDDLLKSIPSYFKYRLNTIEDYQGSDHGILAAFKLYDVLVKNSESAEARRSSLDFGPNTVKSYKLAAASIAVHNMWFPKENQFCLYKRNGLGLLVKHPLLSFRQYPFLFMLGLIDTIEPVKLSTEKSMDALDDFELNLTSNDDQCFLLKIKYGTSCFSSNCFTSRIDELKRWLDLRIDSSENNTHIITFS